MFTILLVVAIATVLGNEYQYGTLRAQVAMGIPRSQYLLAKVIAVLLVGVIGLVLMVAFGTALSVLATLMHGSSLQWHGAFGRVFWQNMGASLLGTLANFSLALLITLFARTVVARVAAALSYTILETTLTTLLASFGGTWAKLTNAFFTPNVRALSFGVDRAGAFNRDLLPPPLAVVVLVGYVVCFLAVSLVVFGRRDITGTA